MTAGWMIGVLVDVAGEGAPARYFFAIAKADQAQAEWAAVDRASGAGAIAAIPFRGMEPVEAIGAISAGTIKAMGLVAGETRALGRKWPRRWIGNEQPASA
ncbi:MAG: hypothetical protein ACYDD1_19765 [Caulobacteraceae bacterium]